MQAKKKINIDDIKVWPKFRWFPSSIKKQFLEKNSVSPKTIKLWSSFKFFFQIKQKSKSFLRFRWFYNNIRIMRKYYTQFYRLKSAKKLKLKRSSCLKKSSNKLHLFFRKLEFRLDLILVRFNLVNNIRTAKNLILNNYVYVNRISRRHFDFILSVNDLLTIKSSTKNFDWGIIRKKIDYKRRRKNKKKVIKGFKYNFLYRNTIKNCIEFNYRIGSAIYIRPLFYNEVVEKLKFKTFDLKLLKKFWKFS